MIRFAKISSVISFVGGIHSRPDAGSGATTEASSKFDHPVHRARCFSSPCFMDNVLRRLEA